MTGQTLLKYYQQSGKPTYGYCVCTCFQWRRRKPTEKRTKEEIHIVITIMTFSSILDFLPYCHGLGHSSMGCALDHPSEPIVFGQWPIVGETS